MDAEQILLFQKILSLEVVTTSVCCWERSCNCTDETKLQ
jgi:hypothetical protein